MQQWNGKTWCVRPGGKPRTILSSFNCLDIVSGPGGALVGVDYSGGRLRVAIPEGIPDAFDVFDIHPWRASRSGGHRFVIGGSGFTSGVHVSIDGVACVIDSVSTTRIYGRVPANASAGPSPVDVIVDNGAETLAFPAAFTYAGP